MKGKVTIAILACCVGVIAGWLLKGSGGIPAAAIEGSSLRAERSNPDSTASVPSAQSSGGVPASDMNKHSVSSAAEPENDSSVSDADTEDRETRQGIIMAHSAEEVRQSIIDNAKLDETQTARLDKAIGEMNRHMLDVSTKWADHIREAGTLDMDTRLRMQHDINGVSVAFSDRMDTEFSGWRGEGVDLTRLVRVTTAFEPFRKIRSEILRGEMGRDGSPSRPQTGEGE